MSVTRALAYGDRETSLGLGGLKDVIRRLSVMPGSRSLVLVSPGFFLTTNHRLDEQDVLERAIRANVTINTIDMRGLYTNIPGGDASDATHFASSNTAATIFLPQYQMEEKAQANDVLAEVADNTGGTFFHNDNDLKGGLNIIAARPEYVYVLGFSPQNLKLDGAYHNLKVTLRNPSNLTLQVRRGYWAPNHAINPAEAAREELRETMFSRDEIQDIPVDLQTEFFRSSNDKAELTVVAHLDLKGLRFRKADDRNNDVLTVVAGLFDRNGTYVGGIQRVVEMHLRDQTLAAMESSGVTLKETFTVAPGDYIVRLVVRDAEGQAMAARNGSVEIR